MTKVNPETAKRYLKRDIAETVDSPLSFINYAYPWDKKNTLLENEEGPDIWQYRLLKDLGQAIRHGYVMNNGRRYEVKNGRIWIAVRSGHGIGKSTLMAWLEQWFASTHPHSRVVTTANTENQLRNKTWMEMAKWHDMLINKAWFDWSATKYVNKAKPATWFGEATPWSEHRTQGFAGTHAQYVMYKFDEASEIPDGVWEVAEGAMTDKGGLKIWVVFGNPTLNTGRFYECFNKHRDRWITYEVDARDSKRTDKALIQEQIDTYGEDSDFIRVRVKGQSPRAGSNQFIPSDAVESAMGKHILPNAYIHAPKILGIDIARYGDDKTVIIKRQGLAAYGHKKYSMLDSVTCAGIIAEQIKEWDPDAVFIDMGSTGAAVYDILCKWGYDKIVTGIWFSYPADDKAKYYNKRVEMVGRVRDWLKNGGCIPEDTELRDDCIAPQYFFSAKEQIQLEKAEDMKARGVASPDNLMALALTFAYPVDINKRKRNPQLRNRTTSKTQYNQLEYNSQQNKRPSMSVTDYNLLGYSR